ncbi:hypothetical protein [Acidisphaera sp. L21]|uniref:hypothetical protein n=1 Tax=Acidisphaera sp. L21 TaxID=1641851 RepID=UPI00131D5F14|nr:hypothetical protein [Acidisphaera sp. L21]
MAGDLIVGFAGFPAHTHGEILAELFGCAAEEAIARFVTEIVEGRQIIAVWRVSGKPRNIWLPVYEGNSLADVLDDLSRFGEPDETVEFRFWDGTKVDPPAA